MIIPLDKLLSDEGNVYESTCAAVKRAYQITVTGDDELEQNQGKVVSLSIKQILTRKVKFRIAEQ